MNNITVEGVTFVLLILGFISGVWWRVEGRIKEETKEARDAAAKASGDAMEAAAKAAVRAEVNSQMIAEHRLHVAETYMTKQGLREVRDEIITAVAGIKADFKHLNERLDRLHDAPPKRIRST
ncbi:hypothetical protein E2A64_10390 [Pseudohoeflea suaedae]|uniref:Uncharacterized protein n=1 Tax=Pseudohoeflea suaedae TaxID=877384 RepID=A0A4R5PKJ0_9HYPH|nr:hypothetical protein [Pseudohoeflea suaedae]TDH35734.1 hypothetical protein E2A64_10390 [Pseudohoeflea suaedae]